LFWTPHVAMVHYTYRVCVFLEWIIFTQGFITPTIYRLYKKLSRVWKRDAASILNYLFSSFGLKGDFSMAKIYGLRPDRVQEFEPKGQDDVPQEERTVFLCKFLDVNLSAQITDQVYTAKGFGNKREELLRAGTQEVEILRKGLVGWKNFNYDEETPVDWEDVPHGLSKQKTQTIMDRNLNKIAPEQRGEIADFIRGSSTPDQD
jgi:hypothetical protein